MKSNYERVMLMSKGNKTRDIRIDLKWKRSYLSELEKKNRRQKAAVADTEAELTALQNEIVELEKKLGAHLKNSD